AVAGVAPFATRRADAAGAPRIAIVGAGLAGLSAGYRLARAGHAVTVFEGSDRLGGRCWTGRGAFADGQLYEHGGELIDQSHGAIRNLIQELGLRQDNLLQAEANDADPLGYFDGVPYTWTQATNDLKQIWQTIHSDVSAASYPTLYDLSTERGRELDATPLSQYIADVAGPVSSKLAELLDVAYNIEYGAETSEQSTLNMLYLLGYSGQGQLRIFGPSNEKYHVRGGNDQITDRMAARIGEASIRRGHELVAIRENTDFTYTLSFANGTSYVADHAVITIPFSILRSSVDISRANFSALKRTAIAEMGMGTNSKLHVQFTDRHWNGLRCNGETFSDRGYQNTWDVTRAQPGTSGLLVDYTGGNVGAALNGVPATLAGTFLKQLEPVLPGITRKWNGRATLDHWPSNRWTKGSYSYWKVGQYQRFAGVEREIEGRRGRCHFAGEHTSVDFQGYLNGAVETGQRAADEVIAALGR
ncbi:MAG TPA: NAD(P)/FAD-dependent oxidoreductase, partial [Solirubrobacteraceae bacterium]|nr:NAD(P)/FAD-dependent oxidoreductase [Solirubrobacteraceae bacterium]